MVDMGNGFGHLKTLPGSATKLNQAGLIEDAAFAQQDITAVPVSRNLVVHPVRRSQKARLTPLSTVFGPRPSAKFTATMAGIQTLRSTAPVPASNCSRVTDTT